MLGVSWWGRGRRGRGRVGKGDGGGGGALLERRNESMGIYC